MAESKIRTFISIFAEEIKGINIPIIQRDYAQGRINNDVNRIRSRFLDALYKALTTDESITLDFVYGEVDEKGMLIPLDGQQRLTTLFLLHWYVSKHEAIEEEECAFLKCFSYDTRYSAREFCKLIAEYTPGFDKVTLSDDIRDQYWYPMDWDNDPTIAAMLVMMDDIHSMFKETSGIWERLKCGAISFYFLSLKEMGLTDELYIKMNSRGKPLTQFEHFKAELEGTMKQVDITISERINRKIDMEWTDMLWPYKGDNEIIDDEFLRYFHFICDIINYRNGNDLVDDPFDMVSTLFSKNNEHAAENMEYVEQLFDCWCGFNIDEFFDKYLTTGAHEDNKSIVGKINNLFLDCCNVYGEMQSGRIRKFPIGRSILLFSFITYLQNKDSVTEEQFIRRIRSINNMVRASEFELRDERMQTLLSQAEEIVLTGIVNESDKSFNVNQVHEEHVKQEWLASNDDKEPLLRVAEDHTLLNGAIRVLGLDKIELYPRFEQLFNCDWDLVTIALLSIGDYSRFINWRYQISSSRNDSVWRGMFNVSEDDMRHTSEVLVSLLEMPGEIDNEFLSNIVNTYLDSDPDIDWRYYIIKYQPMRPGRFGMYRWINQEGHGKNSRSIIMMTTEKSTNGINYDIILKTIYDALKGEIDELHLGYYAYQHDGDKIILTSHKKAVSNDETCFTVYDIQGDGSYLKDATVDIQQNDDNTLDLVDRVQFGISLVKNLASEPLAETVESEE